MHHARSAFLAVAMALVAPDASTTRGGDAPPVDFNAFSTHFRKEMESDKPEARLRAVRRASETLDPRTPELLFDAEAKEGVRRTAIEKQRTEAEAALEAALEEIAKLRSQSPTGAKEMDAYNKKAKKIEARRDEAAAKLRDLAADAMQSSAILGAIVGALGHILDGLPPATTEGAIALGLERWGNPKAPVERRIRYVDLLAAITQFPTGDRIRAIVTDPAEDPRVRTVAFTARVERKDGGVLEDGIALLAEAPGPLLSAVLDGLRRVHRVEAVEPLFAFLARKDIGRLRTDAQRTLWSLTGQKHGPYAQPWEDWWKDAKAAFVMPEKPTPLVEFAAPDKGVTFYGITTFSDKILFVLDVSGSMLELAHADAKGARAQERRIDVARREVVAALSMLEEKKTFNMIFFGNRVVPLNAGMVPAEKATIDRTKRFVNEFEPSGGTNIHDAFEAAFQLAGTAADGKNYHSAIDTIYFMTDGTPTAGKLVKPDEILAAVRGWNRTAQITIHCVAVGDGCDEKFLKQMATESSGIFVHR